MLISETTMIGAQVAQQWARTVKAIRIASKPVADYAHRCYIDRVRQYYGYFHLRNTNIVGDLIANE